MLRFVAQVHSPPPQPWALIPQLLRGFSAKHLSWVLSGDCLHPKKPASPKVTPPHQAEVTCTQGPVGMETKRLSLRWDNSNKLSQCPRPWGGSSEVFALTVVQFVFLCLIARSSASLPLGWTQGLSPIKPSSQKLDARETDLKQMVPVGGPRVSEIGFWSWLSHQMADSEDSITGNRGA